MTDTEKAAEILNEGLDPLAKDPKASQDFSKDAEEVKEKAQTMAKAGRIDEGVEEILNVEKRARMASDGPSCAKLICAVVQLYYDASPKQWDKINEYIVILTKKRGQLKRAVTDIVHLAMGWLESLDKPTKVKLIETLTQVTEGKIFVEVDQARLVRMTAQMAEDDGDIEKAANLLQEVQVETFGAMERREKAEYILNQMRVVLMKKDFVRLQIIAKKINPKLLEADDLQDLKYTYNEFMARYWLNEVKELEVCKCFQSILNTKNIQEEEVKWKPQMENFILYLILAPYSNEQADLLNKTLTMEKKKLEDLPTFKKLVEDFLNNEITAWPLPYEAELKKHTVFSDEPYKGGEDRWKKFHKRVIQHNIKVISKYYKRMRMTRLAEILGLPEKDAEAEVSELVCEKFLFAKMDRPAGIIYFGAKETSQEKLNLWSGDIAKMLDLVENTCHLIQKEQMVHAARAKAKAVAAKK